MKTGIIMALAVSLHCFGQEWTRFRGPNGTGVSEAKTIPTEISDSHLRWKVELPGMGHSSPVIWGDKVFVTTTGDRAGGISVHCLEATDGKMVWQKDFKLEPFPRHKFNSYASSTPAVDENRIYVLWNEPGHYLLTALDHDGRVLWQRDFGPFLSQHGCAISPILHQDKVIVGYEQADSNVIPDECTREEFHPCSECPGRQNSLADAEGDFVGGLFQALRLEPREGSLIYFTGSAGITRWSRSGNAVEYGRLTENVVTLWRNILGMRTQGEL